MTNKLVSSNTGVAACMSDQRMAHTEPDLRGCRPMFAISMRFRKHYHVQAYLLRSIDIGFLLGRIPIFINRCFWHGCSAKKSMPRANNRWWAVKLEHKRRCDNDTTAKLAGRLGRVVPFREHEVANVVMAPMAQELKKRNEECANGKD